MKQKFKSLFLACLLIFSIVACSDDNSSDEKSNNETITQKFTAELGKEAKNTITLNNPMGKEAKLEVYIQSNDSSITIDQKTTCGDIEGSSLNATLKAGDSCEITYTYKPTELATKLLELDIMYSINVCPTPDTVPSYNEAIASNKYITMNVYNYTKNDNNTSPDFINVDMGKANYSYNGKYYGNIGAKSFAINTTKDATYTINNSNGYTLKGDSGCTINGNNLIVNEDKCNITIEINNSDHVSNQSYITLTPTSSTDTVASYYTIVAKIDAEYQYYNNKDSFELNYMKGMPSNDSYVDVVEFSKSATYTINSNNFKVVSTKYNGCKIENNNINLPSGQTTCFWTVDFTNKNAENGSYNATIKSDNKDYNVEGSINSIDDVLQNICKNTGSKIFKLK